MKPSLILFLLLLSTNTFSQKVLIKGKAIDKISRSRMFPTFKIILNDTLRKASQQYYARSQKVYEKRRFADPEAIKAVEEQHKEVMRLYSDTTLVVSPDENEIFRIMADLKDTLFFKSRRFVTQKHAVTDLLNMPEIEIRLVPEICEEPFVCNEKPGKLFVFIGEKISVKRRDPYYCDENTVYRRDGEYEAKYKLIQNIHGTLSQDTVNFTAYDHYGTPKFSHYPYVMLFVRDFCGKLFHVKYQFFDVYPTTDGRWASPGDPYRYDGLPKEITAEPLAFTDTISIDISIEYEHVIKKEYPAPYFIIKNDRVYPARGVYAETLFEIKKKSVLKELGYDIK